jgi:hypothetical protein
VLHCIPKDILDNSEEDYYQFLDERRKLMATKIKKYFAEL